MGVPIFAEQLTEGTVYTTGDPKRDDRGPRTVVAIAPALDPEKVNVRFWVAVPGNEHVAILERALIIEHVAGPLAGLSAE